MTVGRKWLSHVIFSYNFIEINEASLIDCNLIDFHLFNGETRLG